LSSPRGVYPDVSDILARKAEGRAASRSRSFVEKITMMEALRDRLAPMKQLREHREQAAPRGKAVVRPK
jgi:hypothetical protein